MGKFNKTTEQKEPRQQTCQAAGCELMGTRASSLTGSDKWWCRFHYGQEFSKFGLITERVSRSAPMFAHIKRLQRATSADIVGGNPSLYTYLRNPEFSRKESESHGQYLNRLISTVNKHILDGVEHGELENSKALVNQFAGVQVVKPQTPQQREEKRQQAVTILDAEARRMRQQAKMRDTEC